MSDQSTSDLLRLPKRTTPTWDIELLISAALVISMFQLVEPLELWFGKWSALATPSREPVVVYSYLYAKVALFALIATFVLHIAARASWVALVGVHSIYPNGPIWENLNGAAISRRVVKAMTGSIDEAIERADNRATLIFSYGILAAQFSLVVLVLTLTMVAIGMVLENFIDARWAFIVPAIVMFLPITLFSTLDWLIGKRLREGSWMARQLERGVRFSIVANLGQFTQPLLPLVTTNVGGRRGTLLLMLVFGGVLGVVALDTVSRGSGSSVLRGDVFPTLSRSSGVNALHYANLRDETQRYAPSPYIPSELIEGPYLRLFVPYAPDRHDEPLKSECAAEISATQFDKLPSDADALAVQQQEDKRRRGEAELMACFARMLDVRMDGVALSDVLMERHRDPYSGHDGGLAMIDMRALAAGRHELEIKQLPLGRNGLRFQKGRLSPPTRIVFWR